MRRISIAGRALIIMMVVALVACGETTTDSTTDGSEAPGGTTATTTPDSGGDVPNPDTMIVTVNDDVFNLDPAAVNGNDVGMDVILNVYDRLTAIAAEDGAVIPALATEV